MRDPSLSCHDAPFRVIALTGRERIGEASSFHLDLVSPEPVDPSSVLGKSCALELVSPFGERLVHGVVTRFVVIGTAQSAPSRRYELTFCSVFDLLSLRRQTRVFQHLTVPAIVQKVLGDAGFGGDRFTQRLSGDHAERAYVTQYAETDAAFIRRLCEEEGLTFRFEAADGFDAFVLEDDSRNAPRALEAPLGLVDGASLKPSAPAVFACEGVRRRRPGKVTLRDYDPQHPALQLEGVAEAGKAEEKSAEVYLAPGRFRDPKQGALQAKRLLESLRAEARAYQLEANTAALAPGVCFGIEPAADYPGTARPEGDHLVLEVHHSWRKDPSRSSIRVTAIPLDVPFRLPIMTPRPRIHGVHTAIVTGAPGEEIHTDAAGNIRVHFPWDREQPFDDKSSLPVRVMQPNVPGSMLIPRVGWEVMVAFEDGDPDRPYVVGRAYNAKWPPPFGLPANKTMTALSTVSSPGGGARNAVHMDDAAGRQHMVWAAGFGKTTTVGNIMHTQIAGFETIAVTGNQSWTIGGNETVAVKNALMVKVGSQTGLVGGMQSVMIKATGKTSVGSEKVLVGGALLEQVGSPKDGAAAFAEAAAIAGASEIPLVGPAMAKGYGMGKALGEGYAKGGVEGLEMAAGQQATNLAAEHLPAGDAIVAAADGAGLTPWSPKAQAAKAEKEAGGGAGGPGAAGAGAAAAAPGFRTTIVDGAMGEMIGAAYAVTTPSSIKWSTLGPSIFIVGGSHSTSAVKVNRLTGGASADTCASITITAALTIGRGISGVMNTSVAGGLTSNAAAMHHIKAGGSLDLNVAGSMTAEGGPIVFMVGGSMVSAHGGGVLFKASKVTLNGKAVQSDPEAIG